MFKFRGALFQGTKPPVEMGLDRITVTLQLSGGNRV